MATPKYIGTLRWSAEEATRRVHRLRDLVERLGDDFDLAEYARLEDELREAETKAAWLQHRLANPDSVAA
jgi:hypothetical protein